jgi:Ni/Fe-hydrogenase subunit HybB-like protein
MQERIPYKDAKVNRDLLRSLFRASVSYWGLVTICGLIVMVAAACVVLLVVKGLGVAGINRPVYWGIFLVNFVFWVGISHAGVMLSAILRLSKAEWRRPATRAAEVLTIFALATAGLHPFFHVGRMWRMYWPFPYDFQRGIWPNIRSPLVWDPSAILTYLTSSALFVYLALIPDIAVARDRSVGLKHTIYSVLAMGWRGTSSQWKLQIIAGFLLSALILPVFVSVHSIVSTDFAMTMAVKGWHSTVFAPYFVIGAVHSGVAAVITVMIFLRYLFHWEDYIRPDHMDSLGRLLTVVAVSWFFFLVLEIFFGIYGVEGDEIALRELQFFTMPWGALFIIFLITAFFFPVTMWLFKNVRRSMFLMVITTVSVNIGMWLERLLIIVPGLARKSEFTFVWASYKPSAIEITICIGTFALVILGVLLFAKILPLIPLYDIKEGELLKREIQIGKVKVPAVIREE